MDKYPFYYEATYISDGNEPEITEGGFIVATDYIDATTQIAALYEPGLVSMKLECLDDCALTFPVEKAREIKAAVEGAYV